MAKAVTSKERQYPRAIRRRWLVSCISLSIVPVIIGAVLFVYNIQNTKRQTIQNNEVLLTQIQQLMDKGFYDVRTITQSISADPEFNAYSLSGETSRHFLLKKQLQDKLAKYCGYSSYIRSIYIYFWDADLFISEGTVAPPQVIYQAYHSNPAMPFDEWISVVKSQHNDDMLVMPYRDGESGLVFLRTLPSFFSIDLNATIMIWIDMDTVTQLLDSVHTMLSCELNLLLRDGTPVIPKRPIINAANAAVADRLVRAGTRIQRYQAADGTVFSGLSSERANVDYLLATPRDAYMRAISTVNYLFAMGLAVIVLGSILFTANFLYKNYTPIREIMELAVTGEEGATPKRKQKSDEYTVIRAAISDSHSAHTSMLNQLKEQDSRLFDTLLALLIHNVGAGEEDMALLRRYFRKEWFAVMLLQGPFPGTDEQWLRYPEYAIALESAFRTSLLPHGDTIDFWAVPMGESAVFVFNMELPNADAWQTLSESLRQHITQAFPATDTFVYVSPASQDIGEVSALYDQTRYRLTYRQVFGVECNPDTAGYATGLTAYSYGAEDDKRLYNAIVSGSKDRSVAAFEQIWQANAGIGRELQYCLLFDLLGTVLSTTSLISHVPSAANGPDSIARMVTETRSNEEIRKNILMFMGDVCAAFSREHSRSGDKLNNEVLDFIAENYSDSNLSVESISDRFRKSRAHMFALFKEETGMSMLQYITKIRMDEAKRLLTDTDMSVHQIAVAVGYNSAMNFSRAFKKSENLTPTMFREVVAAKKN
ncbi:AraC family transcriptional regulator [Ruminococcaceae bacterium OttesenSCG-928-L11]|nr:AraC family transcriptional regulator [Ruminococcaceae bacterium OttesenSCG-928-L11]